MAPTVLLVDDDPTFRRLARRLLAANGLDVVGEAGSVGEAVAMALDVRPQAALVDVDLPDGDGFELAGRLTALPWRVRVVMTSVQANGGYTNELRRCGAEAFVLKANLARAPLARWLSGE